MHMYLKCFFATQGRLKVNPIFSPASQCNIQGDTTFKSINDRFTQARRHMWAGLDWGYSIRRTIFGIFAPGFDSINRNELKNISLVPLVESNAKLISLTPILMYRMFEAHILMGQAIFLILSSIIYQAPSTHLYVLSAYRFGKVVSTIAFLVSLTNIYFYEKYHKHVSIDRWQQSQETKHLIHKLGKRPNLVYTRKWYQLSDWALVPVSGILFLALPQLYAHACQIFTDQLEYQVAAKPSIPIRTEYISNVDEISWVVPRNTPSAHSKRYDSGYYDIEMDGLTEYEE